MRALAVALLALAVGACGDPDTADERGYTKAPLEDPDLLIVGEEPTAMAALGHPDLPRAEELRPESEGDAGEAEGDAGADGAAQVALAPGVTQEEFDQGRELYTGQAGCQACHGPDAGGSGLAPDLTDAEWLHVPGPEVDAIAELITSGVPQPQQFPGPMPPMGGASLSEAQVRALAAYVASIGQG
jgi:mono/diheme cytochrome c family protein